MFEDLAFAGDGVGARASPPRLGARCSGRRPPASAPAERPVEPPVPAVEAPDAVQLGDPFRTTARRRRRSPTTPTRGSTSTSTSGRRVDGARAGPRSVPALRPSGPPALPPSSPPTAAAPRDEARQSVQRTLRMLRRHWPLIVGLTLLGLVAGGRPRPLTPPTYKAHSVLLIAPGDGDRVGGVAQAPGEDVSRVVNQGLILQQAPQIAERTAETLLAGPRPGVLDGRAGRRRALRRAGHRRRPGRLPPGGGRHDQPGRRPGRRHPRGGRGGQRPTRPRSSPASTRPSTRRSPSRPRAIALDADARGAGRADRPPRGRARRDRATSSSGS